MIKRVCILCNSKTRQLICYSCLKSLLTIKKGERCSICNHPLLFGECPSCCNLNHIYFDRFLFISDYNHTAKKLMTLLKLKKDPVVIKVLYNLLKKTLLLNKINNNHLITIIPDSIWTKWLKGRSAFTKINGLLKKEGYNIQLLISRKTLLNAVQKKMNALKRMSNVKKIYELSKKLKNINKKQTVYLIDDIYTTGATLNYCSRLLKKAGFEKVIIISIFRTLLNNIK